MKLTTQLYIFLITVLAVALYIKCDDEEKINSCANEQVTTDTVVIFETKIDTITEFVFKEVERKTTDTVYIETENKPFLALPVVSKHFAKENLYDLWISGVEPLKMDSIKLYQQSKQETIVITDKSLLKPKTNSLFANAGIISFNGVLSPRVGISIKTKKERIYGLEIGSCNGKMFYGVNVGFKINK